MKEREKGQGLVEFSILLPIIALVIVGVVALFHLIAVKVTNQNAVREGAREASVWRPNEVTSCSQVVLEAVVRTSGGFFDPARDTITTSDNCTSNPWARIASGTNVYVSVTIQWSPIFFGTLGQPYWQPPFPIPLTDQVTIRHE